MKIEVKIDENYKDPLVIILTEKMNEEVSKIIEKVRSVERFTLIGFDDDDVEIIPLNNLLRIYSENKKVYAQTEEKTYRIKQRLYEIEGRIDTGDFIRIFHSEIINFKMVRKLDLSFTGTIGIYLKGNVKTYVSRRYVQSIKKYLGI